MAHGGDIYNNKVNIDFSVSLNPFVKEVLGDAFDDAIKNATERALKRAGCYPDPKFKRLREALAKADGVSPQNILPGNGASEVLLAAIRSFDPKRVLLPVPCFTGYEHILGGISDCDVINFQLKEENGHAISEDLVEYLENSGNDIDILILTDPTNPFGRNIDEDVIYRLLDISQKRNIKVILDESFYLLSDAALKERSIDTKSLIDKYENLVIIRSYTKLFALPGIRMGYAIANSDRIEMIRAKLSEWNMSVINEEMMIALSELIDENFIKSSIEKIQCEREYLVDELGKRVETVYPSDSVYITLKSVEDLYEKMLEKGILIRDCSDYAGLEKGYYRVAVKTREENEKLIWK